MEFHGWGTSMVPFIRPGDRLIVRARKDRLPRIGEVILYERPGPCLIAHRVVGRERGPAGARSLRVRGDRLWAPLERVQPAQVLGSVIAVEGRKGRRDCARLRYRLPVWIWIGTRPLMRGLRSALGRIRRRWMDPGIS